MRKTWDEIVDDAKTIPLGKARRYDTFTDPQTDNLTYIYNQLRSMGVIATVARVSSCKVSVRVIEIKAAAS